MSAFRPITRVLIANRGEIARRIARTLHEMGISSVAVYADGDAGEPFVAEADQAVSLQGESASETYLDQDKILAAARATQADAVHPGYGFLAENAGFAQAAIDAGLVWIGPPPDAIAAMGDKLSAKALMEKAGVPTLPSVEPETEADFAAAAEQIGYPVLVKASAGGGGRGMRVVAEEPDLEAAIAAARREAGAAFGDDTVFLERWLEGARHVEVQVLGDTQGATIHCFERECSIQRRHQKLIEECPSPAVDDALRTRMGEAAVNAARAIGYASAGTVEFLLKDGDFRFLEMNTRLQVEHPVTEAVTGLDLVREQIRIAQGEPLGYGQEDLRLNGHAIEARLCAEDPERDFLPSTGTVAAWTPSPSTPARFDSGIEGGSRVGIAFDSLLAKIIVHAPTRREAALRLARALETTRIQGVRTNREFLANTLRTDAFLAGDTSTDFIERVQPARSFDVPQAVLDRAAVAAALAGEADARAQAPVLATLPSGWRNSLMPPQKVKLRWRDDELTVAYRRRRDGSFDVTVGEREHRARAVERSHEGITFELDGQRTQVALTRTGTGWLVQIGGHGLKLAELSAFPERAAAAAAGGLHAPMPGKVASLNVTRGDRVEAGALLLVLEAMKMELRITAPVAGIVSELPVEAGQQVANGALLAVVSDDDADDADKDG